MTRYNTVQEMPKHYQAEAQRLVDRGALKGREPGKLDVSEDMLRVMIVCQRLIDKEGA